MSGLSHFVHIVLCLLTGFLWIPIYILCIICSGNKRRQIEDKKRDEELQLLRIIANQTKGEK